MRTIYMKKEKTYDYNAHYDSIFATEKDQAIINAADFLGYFSELIIKNSKTLETKIINGRVIVNE
ncbi:hypothetical protein [Niallia circulans]|uniref:hypothetical protein n=1 Tax=Niallia circulans TaxID=1397 RepID=UPI0015606787|nr:hypothetical protein [Niallia circulans]NRG34422.1 hypothetical protein [Niallia circulans]